MKSWSDVCRCWGTPLLLLKSLRRHQPVLAVALLNMRLFPLSHIACAFRPCGCVSWFFRPACPLCPSACSPCSAGCFGSQCRLASGFWFRAPVAPPAPQTPPAVASSVPQASAPTPAVQPAGSFSQAPETVQPRQAAALTAQVDLSNPAAVQRLWHSVTASLRKVNPARGVLFMNAKVSAEADGQGIVVEFGKDSAFAFNAAQKAEVQELLAETIQTVAGGTVPYRLALAGNSSSAAPAAAQPASAQSGMASQSNAAPPATKNPYAAKAVAAVRAAQAAAKANQAPATRRRKGEPGAAFNLIPKRTSYVAPSAPQQMGGGVASSPSPDFQASSMPRRSAAVQQAPAATPSVSAVPEPYDDQVPLDVYGSSVSAEYGEDPYAQQYGSSPSQQSSVSASSGTAFQWLGSSVCGFCPGGSASCGGTHPGWWRS